MLFLVILLFLFLLSWLHWLFPFSAIGRYGITVIVLLALLGMMYCVLLISDKSYWLVIDETGITFKCMPWLIAIPKFIEWASVAAYYNYTYAFDHEVQPEYLMLVCTNGKKEKITISGLDRGEDEILGAVKRYYSSTHNAEAKV